MSVFECTDLRSFTRAFVRLPEIHAYGAGMLAAAAAAAWFTHNPWDALLPVALVGVFYPVFEYVLHRGGLHATLLCHTPPTAKVWWRIHYRHHADPRDEKVILAAPWSLFMVVVLGAGLAASLRWSWPGYCAALAASFAVAIAYEYFHSLAHSRVTLKGGYLLHMRQHHIAHHYFDERRNYGIVTDIADRLFGTVRTPGPARSPTVHNLGYRGELAARYPYIARIEDERRAQGTD